MNKKIKIILSALIVVVLLGGIAFFTVYQYNKAKEAKIDKIESVYVIDGITNEIYDMTEEEIELVKNQFRELTFKESGNMPIYHTCIVVETESGKKYMLKYSDTEDLLYLTGDMENGYYSGAAPLAETLRKYEKEYGYGTIIEYGGQ